MVSTGISQSFLLRFWPEIGTPGRWRGEVWDVTYNQQTKIGAAASPEDAFELVKRTLDHHSEALAAEHISEIRLSRLPSAESSSLSTQPSKLISLWRRFRGERP
jgi:hypothetical protein